MFISGKLRLHLTLIFECSAIVVAQLVAITKDPLFESYH